MNPPQVWQESRSWEIVETGVTTRTVTKPEEPILSYWIVKKKYDRDVYCILLESKSESSTQRENNSITLFVKCVYKKQYYEFKLEIFK